MKIKKLTLAIRAFIIIMFLLLILPRIGSLTVDNIIDTGVPLPLVMLAFFIAYAIKPVVMLLPVNVLYVSAGVLFPMGWALFITCVGVTVMLCVGYFNGKELGEEKAGEILAKHTKAAAFLDSRKNITSVCFFVRLLPFPKDLFSMFFGAVAMPFYKFMLISLAGMSPVMISSVIAGVYLAR